jgi:DNA-binding LacI/PurR family transcriptional regulator
MPTIKEVAKLAGIAVSTASDALNGKPGVSPVTRQRALEAAEKLGYVPNLIAQGLVTRATKNIGIVLSGPSSFGFFDNPTFFEVIKAVAAALNRSGYHALLNVITSEEEAEVISWIARSGLVEALILVGTRKSDRELAAPLWHPEIFIRSRARSPYATCWPDLPEDRQRFSRRTILWPWELWKHWSKKVLAYPEISP